MRGDNVMMGYLDDEESTREAFKGGWFHSGDLGVVHEDGYVELRDRLKDVIISGGENIATIEVEQALAAHDSVSEAAVVAAPHERWGEVPVAFVTVSGDEPDVEELQEFARERLARFKVPEAHHLRRRAAQDRHRQDPEVRAARAGGRGRGEGIDCAAVYAAVLHEYNEAPRYEEVADPSPEAGQVVVEVGAAALHHLDLLKASGNFYLEQPLPSVVGHRRRRGSPAAAACTSTRSRRTARWRSAPSPRRRSCSTSPTTSTTPRPRRSPTPGSPAGWRSPGAPACSPARRWPCSAPPARSAPSPCRRRSCWAPAA